MLPALLLSAELILSTGHAHFAKCGGNGCWQQQPLPSAWTQSTNVHGVGLRIKDIEIRYHQFGTVGVNGRYVQDEDYDPKTATVKSGAPEYNCSITQSTKAVSLMYMPQWKSGDWFASIGGGAFAYRQEASYWFDGPPYGNIGLYQKKRGATPAIGLSIGHRYISLDALVAKRVRATPDMPLGGTVNIKAPPGLKTLQFSLRVPF